MKHGHRKTVRIYCRCCRKPGKAGNVYTWTRIYHPIPAKFKESIEKFFGKDLAVDVKVEDDDILVIKAKRVSIV